MMSHLLHLPLITLTELAVGFRTKEYPYLINIGFTPRGYKDPHKNGSPVPKGLSDSKYETDVILLL
jgi:hypothetical protein